MFTLKMNYEHTPNEREKERGSPTERVVDEWINERTNINIHMHKQPSRNKIDFNSLIVGWFGIHSVCCFTLLNDYNTHTHTHFAQSFYFRSLSKWNNNSNDNSNGICFADAVAVVNIYLAFFIEKIENFFLKIKKTINLNRNGSNYTPFHLQYVW